MGHLIEPVGKSTDIQPTDTEQQGQVTVLTLKILWRLVDDPEFEIQTTERHKGQVERGCALQDPAHSTDVLVYGAMHCAPHPRTALDSAGTDDGGTHKCECDQHLLVVGEASWCKDPCAGVLA